MEKGKKYIEALGGLKRCEMRKLLVFTIALSLIAPLFFGCDRIENKDVPVKLKWRYKTGFYQADFGFYERFYSIPSVVDGVVYDGLTHGCLYAIDKDTGELKWKFCDKQAVFSFPSVADGIVYVGKWSSSYSNNKSYLYAISASSGKLMWRTKLSIAIDWYGSPTVSDGIVYIGSADSIGMGAGEIQYHLCAIDAVRGEILWRYEVEGGVEDKFPPLVVDDTVYFGGEDYYLYAVDAKSGELKWRFWAEHFMSYLPCVVEGVLYIGSVDHYLYAIDTDNGELKWRFKTEQPFFSVTSPVVVNGVVYVWSHDGYFYALNADNGTLK